MKIGLIWYRLVAGDIGPDRDGEERGAGKLLADPVPETARIQTGFREAGRVGNGPAGEPPRCSCLIKD